MRFCIDDSSFLFCKSNLKVKNRSDKSTVIFNSNNNEFRVYSGIEANLLKLLLKTGNLAEVEKKIRNKENGNNEYLLNKSRDIFQQLLETGWFKIGDNNSIDNGCCSTTDLTHFDDNGCSGLDEIFLEITKRCNLNCHHCYIDNEGLKNEIKTEQIMKIIDDVDKMGILKIKVTGGEPMMHKDFFDIIKYIESKNIGIRLYTNGSFLNRNTIDKLYSIGIKEIQISMDGFNSHTHDNFRRTKGNLDHIKNVLPYLDEKGINTIISYTVTDYNVLEISELGDYLRKFQNVKLNASTFMNYHGQEDCIDEILKVSEETIKKLKDYAYSMQDIWSKKISYGFTYDNRYIGYCGTGVFSCYISSSGKVYLCPVLQDDSFKLGDINDSSIDEIWTNSIVLKEYRKHSLKDIDKCSTCISVGKCRGGCRARAYFNNNNILSHDPISCKMFNN